MSVRYCFNLRILVFFASQQNMFINSHLHKFLQSFGLSLGIDLFGCIDLDYFKNFTINFVILALFFKIKNIIPGSGIQRLFQVHNLMPTMLHCLFLKIRPFHFQERLHHDGNNWLRFLCLSPSGFLSDSQVRSLVCYYAWCRLFNNALWKTLHLFCLYFFRVFDGQQHLIFQLEYILTLHAYIRNVYVYFQLFFVISFVVASLFMDVFAIGSDTLLLCYCL